jgi:RHS repeat-associated protein
VAHYEETGTQIVLATPVDGDKRFVYVYDYMGRRVRKTASTYTGSGWDVTTDQAFIYDGWNVVLVLDATDGSDPDTLGDFTTETKYTWGLDLSGSLHGAGGVGGLLEAVEVGGATGGGDAVYWFFNDANGNVTQILDVTDSNNYKQVAHYEYTPFGKLLYVDNNIYDYNGNQLTGTGYALDNPFRFSTKWLDDELASTGQTGAVGEEGLYYYGKRYYSPSLGRWLNRDPIEENGGLNLYAFVGNGPVNSVDPLGRDRYIVKDAGVHTGICVDIWQRTRPKVCCTKGPYRGQWKMCFQKRGMRCFDFRTHVSSAWVIINIIPSIVVGAGDVVESGRNGRSIAVTIKSRCKEDRALLETMRDQVANPDRYSLLFYNCNRWTENYIDTGLDGSTGNTQCGGCDVDCK